MLKCPATGRCDGRRLIQVRNWDQRSWFCSLLAGKSLLNLKIRQMFCAYLVNKLKKNLRRPSLGETEIEYPSSLKRLNKSQNRT